ncbi:MAG TPA: hypothetical protein VL485_07250 [Ktedonobacteraceae bacterium]|nr:hypothetical protein [Ktedonobacteraceae bacterium]
MTNYRQAVGNANTGMTQEMIIRTVDGLSPQSGITSVVIEQEREGHTPETNHSTNEDRTGRPVPSLSTEEQTSQTQQPIVQEPSAGDKVDPTLEQKLTFLKYLIHRGQINEGFEEGQTPEQYRKQ